MKKIFVTIVGIVMLCNILHAQKAVNLTQTIKGTVVDYQSNSAITDATIRVVTMAANPMTQTDKNGYFTISNVPIGRHTLRISHVNYEEAFISNIEVTSSKEVIVEIQLKEKIKKAEDVVVKASRSKIKPFNEAAIVSSRQLSIDEAFRYSGTRNDPSRMAQNFAGVSGSNDARNDIIIRGNSPSGVLWRMDGIDIPNPNHFSTLGSTGGPVSILNINTLRNSDFLTSAFPSQYGNAIAGVFDLRMRTGNTDRTEYIGQMGFNGFELGIEGPIQKKNKSSYLFNYRYSMLAALQKIGLQFGTGTATPYYQDVTFKVNLPTQKMGTFSIFGLGGESHINFPASNDEDNLYQSSDGSSRERNFQSLTGVIGASHQFFYNSTTSSKTILAVSGFKSDYNEDIVDISKPKKLAFLRNNSQVKYTLGHTLNKKFNAKNQLTIGVTADLSSLVLLQDYIKNGDSVLTNNINTKENVILTRGFVNYFYRVNEKLSTNMGLYSQLFSLNNSTSIEPRWNAKYQLQKNQSLAFGIGLHSQIQPLEVYYFKTRDFNNNELLTNKDLGFTKSIHTVLGYDISFKNNFRIKTEVYYQSISNIPVEKIQSSFSMLNTGADFGFPDKANLINKGKGYNKGVELTLEKFLHKGLYYLLTVSVFDSKFKGSDEKWRNTAFNSNYVVNALAGKEIAINSKNSIGIDSKITYTGGQRYTPFNIPASMVNGFVIYKEEEAYSLQNNPYFRFDLKLSYIRNGKKTTQKWYIDLQNLTGQKNIYIRTLTPQTGKINQINQIGFFPNVNYQITF